MLRVGLDAVQDSGANSVLGNARRLVGGTRTGTAPIGTASHPSGITRTRGDDAEPRNDSLEANWDANKAPHDIDNPAP